MNLTGVYRTMRLSWESDNEDQEIHITARPQPLQKILEVRINSKSAFNFIAQCKNYVSSRTSCWTVNIGISMLWYLMQLEWGVNILSRCEERKGGYALFYNHIPSYNIFVTMVPNSTDGVDFVYCSDSFCEAYRSVPTGHLSQPLLELGRSSSPH